jgi:hypothetical protein
MINEMRENDPEAYQRYLAEQQELLDVSAWWIKLKLKLRKKPTHKK